jgi:hypothetical protein
VLWLWGGLVAGRGGGMAEWRVTLWWDAHRPVKGIVQRGPRPRGSAAARAVW